MMRMRFNDEVVEGEDEVVEGCYIIVMLCDLALFCYGIHVE